MDMRLIVVENDPIVRRAITQILRNDGMHVIAQPADGAEALRLLKKARPDVILTDWDMPKIDGIELVHRLRAAGDHTPIIMLSGQSAPHAIARAKAAGVNRYLIKPVSAELLISTVRQTHHQVAA